MLLSLLCLLISLLFVVDLLEVELVTGVFLILEVAEEGHGKDPEVSEYEKSYEEPL